MNIFGGVNSALPRPSARTRRKQGLSGVVVIIVPVVSVVTLVFLLDAAVMARHVTEHVFTTSCSVINFSLLRELSDNIEICKAALRSIESSSRELRDTRRV